MDNKKLLKISIMISVLGMSFLLLISNLIQPKEINSYSELELGKLVKTTGKILSINTFNDFSIIRLDNNITITCNCFFQENQEIEVEGIVSEYKNSLQIEAETIKTK